MPSKIRYIYWDSSVFLAYFKEEVDRVDTLIPLLDQIRQDKTSKIVTSTISKVEVARVIQRDDGAQLSPDTVAIFDAFWNNDALVTTVDLHDHIALRARTLMRDAFPSNLKTMDAIHLATAQWVGTYQIHTYDPRWQNYVSMIGIEVCAPYLEQPKLPSL